jgi:hypothetical protein
VPTCGIFPEPASIGNPAEYRDLIRRLISLVNQGTLKMSKSSCPLERVLADPFPDDVLFHNFHGIACRRAFALRAESYHGHLRWMRSFCEKA